MKRVLSLLIALTFLFALAGCSADNSATESASPTENTITDSNETSSGEPAPTSNSKALVVYFSRTGEQYGVGVIEKGNTAIVAEMIAEQTGADSFEILPKEDNYPMTYDALTEAAKEEQNNNVRPAIKDTVENFDSYDVIYLGYPIWWGDLPMICYTFLESYDFTGKTVVPFCTHAGSGNAGTQSKIQSVIPSAEVKEVLAVVGADAQNDPDSVRTQVIDWLG